MGRRVQMKAPEDVKAGDWAQGAYAIPHAQVYGVPPTLTTEDARALNRLAADMFRDRFASDGAAFKAFTDWAWRHEHTRFKAGATSDYRLSWRHLFSSEKYDRYRIALMKAGKPLPTPAEEGPGNDHDDADDAEPDAAIAIDTDEFRVANEALARLVREPRLFHRGGKLVHIVHDKPSPKVLLRACGAPSIEALTLANLREMVSRCCSFQRSDGRAAHTPEWLVRAILDRKAWPELRRLRGVVTAPVLRADGTVIKATGYDEATELWVQPTGECPAFDDMPTREDALRARDELLEVFCDFPFETPAHLAACIAAVLTPFTRYAYDGPAPLFAIDKSVKGSGGTLLADAIGVIATGASLPRMVAAKNPEEERKRITSIALAGDPIVLIDNVAGVLGTDALDNALTATAWSDRLLTTNTTVKLPLFVTWFATGNNLEFGADTLRRVCHIRIDVLHERPEERSGFKHPRLLAWVTEHRARLVAAVLTILRAYAVAGAPDMRLKPWGSFEAWSAIVRNAVVWIGLDDPGKTREELTTSSDAERNTLADLLTAWSELFGEKGASVTEVVKRLSATPEFIDSAAKLRTAIDAFCPSRGPSSPSARALGARLSRVRKRVVAGMMFDTLGAKTSAGVVWVVRKVTAASDSRDSSDSETVPSSSLEIQKPGEGSKESLESPESLARFGTREEPRNVRRRVLRVAGGAA